MKKKVVFIINSVQQQRCIKRIEEFITNGYEVQAYGFSRTDTIPTLPENFQIEIIGSFDNRMSYLKRLMLMYKALRPIFRRHIKEDVIYYYFLLDVAMVCRWLCRKPYIYEESDLMQTYIPSAVIRNILNRIDRYIIRHSLITTMTSEGFAQYHFGTTYPNNIVMVPNRLNSKVLQLPYKASSIDMQHLRFAFVGSARFDSVVNFVQVIATHFPQHEFHFYGTLSDHVVQFQQLIDEQSNIYFHGKFSNPKDLPAIYEQIDLVLATYDTIYDNVRYAEPNKLYEAAYFRTPIIVSQGTFLASKVKKWGIGFEIDALNTEQVVSFISSLTRECMERSIDHCSALDRQQLINENPLLFDKLNSLICI